MAVNQFFSLAVFLFFSVFWGVSQSNESFFKEVSELGHKGDFRAYEEMLENSKDDPIQRKLIEQSYFLFRDNLELVDTSYFIGRGSFEEKMLYNLHLARWYSEKTDVVRALQTLDAMEEGVTDFEKAQYQFVRGNVFSDANEFEQASKHFDKALKSFSKAGSRLGELSVLYSIARLNYNNTRWKIQEKHLDSVFRLYAHEMVEYPFVQANFWSVDGFQDLVSSRDEDAKANFMKVLNSYRSYQDSANISKTSFNISMFYAQYPEQMDSALYYYNESVTYGMNYQSRESGLYGLIRVLSLVSRGLDSTVVLQNHGFNSVLGLIDHLDSIYYTGKMDNKMSMHFLDGKERYIKAFGSRDQYIRILEEEVQLYYHLYVSDTSKQQLVNYQLNLEQAENDKLRLNAEKLSEKNKRFVMVVIGSLVLLVLLLIIWIVSRRNRNEKHKNALLNLERQRDQERLGNAEQKLELLREQMLQKTALLEQFRKELDQSSQIIDERRMKLLEMKILTEEDWGVFKSTFEVVYPKMDEALMNRGIQMTEGELRILMLLKMKLNRTQISEITGIGVESVRKAMYRLRKKIDPVGIEELLLAF